MGPRGRSRSSHARGQELTPPTCTKLSQDDRTCGKAGSIRSRGTHERVPIPSPRVREAQRHGKAKCRTPPKSPAAAVAETRPNAQVKPTREAGSA